MKHAIGFMIWPLLTQSIVGQHMVLLQPDDAIRLAEASSLFASRYAVRGCPSAEAGVNEAGDIALRINDGCHSSVSTRSGDYVVNRKTGAVRDPLIHTVVIAETDPAVLDLWKEIEGSLLTEGEGTCLVEHARKPRRWQEIGILTGKRITTTPDGTFSVALFPTAEKPAAPEQLLRFRVDRRNYRIFEGRFSREDLSGSVLALRNLLLASKLPAELSAEDVLAVVREIPEVSTWLGSDQCRGVRLDEDLEGQTYYSVNLFRWCQGERQESLAGFAIGKRSGKILSPQGLVIKTSQLPGAQSRLRVLTAQKSHDRERLLEQCEK